MKIVVILRNDLRLHDHPALHQASLEGEVLPIYVLEDDLGSAFKYWTHRHLQSLQSSLKMIGGNLYVSSHSIKETIESLKKEMTIDAVYYNRSYHPKHRLRDEEYAHQLDEEGIQVKTFEGTMLLSPWKAIKENGEPYKVFTPFYKQFRTKTIPQAVPKVKEDATFVKVSKSIRSISSNIDLLNLVVNRSQGIDEAWDVGEDAAIEQVKLFIDEDIEAYKVNRDFPSINGTSRISPYLAVGTLSVRSVYHYALKMKPDVSEAFIRQLVWREFAYHMIVYYPQTVSKPLNEKFDRFPWLNNTDHYEKWCHGQTGIPLIDAGMRELWTTGYMHNRVRMNVASYLTKHLLIDFTHGMAWFQETLIDADIANNTFGWQWASGSGADAAPYFRIFNPYLQSEKFDSDATYIRKWLPELKNLSNKDIIEPDQSSKEVLEVAGVILGETYPYPIVTHKSGRTRALLAYGEIKNKETD